MKGKISEDRVKQTALENGDESETPITPVQDTAGQYNIVFQPWKPKEKVNRKACE